MFNTFTLNGPTPLAFSNLFRPALAGALTANATLAALVADRVFPVEIPRSSSGPSLAYEVRSVDRLKNMDGPNGIAAATVRYTCRSPLASDVDQMREELRNLFDGSRNPLSQVQIVSILSRDEEDSYEEPADSSDAGTFEQRFTLVYRYREVKPTLS